MLIPAPVKTTISSLSLNFFGEILYVIIAQFIDYSARRKQNRHFSPSFFAGSSRNSPKTPPGDQSSGQHETVANEPSSPMAPIRVGITPPPMKNPKGTVKATARLRALAGVIMAIAAKAAGKNHTASNG